MQSARRKRKQQERAEARKTAKFAEKEAERSAKRREVSAGPPLKVAGQGTSQQARYPSRKRKQVDRGPYISEVTVEEVFEEEFQRIGNVGRTSLSVPWW